jgi:hypothetical protein
MIHLLVAIAFIEGPLLIIGGFRKWPWLIDPPDRPTFYHPLPFVSAFLPKKWLRPTAIAIGFLWIALGAFVLLATR